MDEAIEDFEKRLAVQTDESQGTTLQFAVELCGRLERYFGDSQTDVNILRVTNLPLLTVGWLIQKYNQQGEGDAESFRGGVKVTIEDI